MQLRPAFVVSAINPQDKNNGTTSQLINIHDNWHRYRQSGWSDMKNNIDPFRKLIDTHNELENNLGLTQDSRDLMKSDEIIESNVRKWRETLDNGFKLDDFVYLGELLSANIVSRYLNRHGVDSHVVDLTGIMKYHHIKISNSDERKLLLMIVDLGYQTMWMFLFLYLLDILAVAIPMEHSVADIPIQPVPLYQAFMKHH